MQNLREAIQGMTKKACDDVAPYKLTSPILDWKPVSKARGELAQYMSKLEGYQRSPYRELWDSIPSGPLPPEHVNFKCSGGHRSAQSAPTPPVEPPQRTFAIHLPPVPEGYVLEIVGNMLTMRPMAELAVKEGKPPRNKRKRAKR